MTTTTIVPNKRTSNTPVYLPAGQTSGSFTISIPFVAEYIMILNDTAATIAVMIGEQSTQGPEAQIWTPGTYLSLPLLQETQKLTVFWSSQSPITADNNLVQFYFSNVTIPLQGGKYGSAAESTNVDVMNTVTVQYGSIPNVNINAMPVISGSDGTNNHPLKTDATGQLNVNVETLPAFPAGMNNIGHVNVDQIPAIPAGTNNIGHVNVDQLPALPAGTANIGKVDLNSTHNLIQGITAGPVSSSQITVNTTAVALVNGVVNGQKIKIKNIDATNSIFIGSSSVTGTNGYELFPKDTIDLDIVSGSTIAIYGISTAGTPIASVLTLN